MGEIGYGSGDGDLVYYTNEGDILSPAIKFIARNSNSSLNKGSLISAMRDISNFPFRPGSIRIVFVGACSPQDIPKVSYWYL